MRQSMTIYTASTAPYYASWSAGLRDGLLLTPCQRCLPALRPSHNRVDSRRIVMCLFSVFDISGYVRVYMSKPTFFLLRFRMKKLLQLHQLQ